MKSTRLKMLVAAMMLACGTVVTAQSLNELFNAARGYDATYLGAKLQHEANLAKAEQGRAQLLPQIGLGLGASRNEIRNSVPAYTVPYGNQNATVTATQPLYRPQNVAAYEQAKKSIELSKAQLDAAEQDLIVRVSQSYFDVLTSKDALTFVLAQKAAVAEQLAAAKRNFEVGTTTITDAREAQAQYDLVLAQEIAASNDLRVKLLALDQLVGKASSSPQPVQLPVSLPALQPDNPEAWILQSEDNHPSIRAAQVGLDVAKLETAKAQAGHKPTVDLVAQYGITNNSGYGSNGSGNYRDTAGTIGVQFNLPLFAGFSIQNRVRETLALEEKAQADLDVARRTVAQSIRSIFYGVVSGMSQVKALEAAEASSQSALDANKLGYQVGVRINIDVLNSQSQLYKTKSDLAKARYDVLVGGLKLRQATGVLKVDDLNAVNVLLAK